MKQYRTQTDIDAVLGPQLSENTPARADSSNSVRAGGIGVQAGGPEAGASAEWADSGQVEAQHGSGHHDEIGGDEVVQVGPHQLTTGQLNELVDYVQSLDELAALSPDALERGLELIETMEEGGLSASETSEFDAIFPNYAAIALDNSDHFAPPSDGTAPAGSANFLGQLRQHFGDAHDLAAAGDTNGALACAGWGGHYVADAFSAGHLVNKDEIMFNADVHLQAYGRGPVFGGAASEIIAEGTAVSGWGIRTLTGGVRDLNASDLFNMLSAADVFQHVAISGAIAKAIHDRLAGDGASRVIEVESSGRTWLLGGDGDLDPVAKDIASGLLEQAYTRLEAVSTDPGHISKADFLAELEAGLPTPTADGQARIDQIVSNVFESPETLAHALAEASLHEFDTIMASFQSLPLGGLILIRREAPAMGGPTIGDLYGNIDDLLGDHQTIGDTFDDIHTIIGEPNSMGDLYGDIDELIARLGQ